MENNKYIQVIFTKEEFEILIKAQDHWLNKMLSVGEPEEMDFSSYLLKKLIGMHSQVYGKQ